MELSNETLLKLEQYLNGQMDLETKNLFESEIDNSQELREFIALYHQIDNLEDDATWDVRLVTPEQLKKVAREFRSKDVQEFSQKLTSFREEVQPTNLKPKRRFPILGYTLIAACLAAVIYFSVTGSPSMTQLYQQNSNWQELPSFAAKGDSTDQQKRQLEAAFKDKDYREVTRLSELILADAQEIDPSLYLYMGIAYLELDRYELALTTFNILAESDATDNHKAFWYTALVYLKKGDREKTVQALEQVAAKASNYKAKEAKMLLTKL